MYTNNPITPSISLATRPHSATLRPPWWNIPEDERLCIHAFSKIPNQIRLKFRNATRRSLHHISIYRRLILKAKYQGARTKSVGTALHSYIRKSPKEGITILKFLYDQLYNGKLAYRYKLAPIDACPLCGLPDSCTHIAGECKSHNNQFINRHNAACQLTHASIITAFNRGDTIYSPHDLRLITMDAGTKHHTTDDDISDLNTPFPLTQNGLTPSPSYDNEWLALTGPPPTLHRNHRVDLSIETKTLLMQAEAETWDEEGAAAPRYIPA